MKILTFDSQHSESVIKLFRTVFSESEGKEEGSTLGHLVSELITTTNKSDIVGFIAIKNESLIGSVFFTRLTLPTEKTAYILSPMAIATDQQKKGYGLQLIQQGIEYLKSQKIDFVFTYGNPAFYSKAGFQQISENVIAAPFKLSQPEGWLLLSLNDEEILDMKGKTQCVEALNHQEYW